MSNRNKARIVLAAAYPESVLTWARFPADLNAPKPPPSGAGFGAYDPQARHGGCTAVICKAQLNALLHGSLLAIDVREEYVLFFTIGD